MRVKICGIRNENDVRAALTADADAVGFLVGQVHASPDFILPSTAMRLAGGLPPYVSPVLVTHLSRADEIIELVTKTGVYTVQLHGGSSIDELRKLRDLMPLNGKIILAIHVTEDRISPEPEDFYPLINAILLDSFDKETGQVGGTGQAHDWRLSANFVKQCPRPVILAGGLNPGNIAEAVSLVHPYGVDANSGLKDENGGRSPERCQNFVRLAKLNA